MSSSNNEHAYPPATWQGLLTDPQFQAFVDHVVQLRTKEFQDAQVRDSTARETAMKNWAEEVQVQETAFQTQIATLSDELAAAKVLQSNLDHDLHMAEPPSVSVTQPIAKDKSSVRTSKKRAVHNKQSKPVPDSAPSRNLRSSTNTASEYSSQAPAFTIQLRSSPPSWSSGSNAAYTTTEQATAPSHQKKGKQIKKPASHKYRLLASELLMDIGGLQKAMALHVCILWGILDARGVPNNPPELVLRLFSARFSTEEAIYESQAGPEIIPRSLIQIGSSVAIESTSRIAAQVRQVEEHMLAYTQSLLARFRLTCWCPDL